MLFASTYLLNESRRADSLLCNETPHVLGDIWYDNSGFSPRQDTQHIAPLLPGYCFIERGNQFLIRRLPKNSTHRAVFPI